ncbi:MAG: serine O-acetyltransferase [Anaerolineales bacterium]|nr:serine O-acetyltransferase [Anaerolineales bacterium]
MISRIKEDIRTVFAKDPAARSVLEVLCCYPGLHAIWLHRVAHSLWHRRLRLLARLIAHTSRRLTGIEIHPGAMLGRRVFIDHGMGVVIGETAEVGNDVLMYQGVVLGGTSLQKVKRHPTIGDHVVIGAGATVLGPIEVGNGARIGAGSVVVKPVPAGATIVGVPGRVAGGSSAEQPAEELEHGRLPDPTLRTIAEALDRASRLEERVRALEHAAEHGQAHPPAYAPQRASSDQAAPARELAPALAADIWKALEQVIDPEVGADIVSLGLVREIRLNGRGLEVHLRTCKGCSMVGYLVEQIRREARSVLGDEPVEVVLVDEPLNWDCASAYFREGAGI